MRQYARGLLTSRAVVVITNDSSGVEMVAGRFFVVDRAAVT